LDFVAQAESQLKVVQASAGREPLDFLNRKVSFKARLEDQPLCYQQVFGRLETPGYIALMADKHFCLDFIIIGRQPFQGDDGLRARHIAPLGLLRLKADANLKIVVPSNEATVEQLEVYIIVVFDGGVSHTFAFEPDAVEAAAAAPPLDVPADVAIMPFWTVFEQVS